MDLRDESRLQLSGEVSYQSFGASEDGVLFSLANDHLYRCNPSASYFLELVADGRTLGDVVRHFASRYESADGQLRDDLVQLAGELAREGLIVVA